MKRITFNRIMIAIYLIYCSVAAIGWTGSIWCGVQMLLILLGAMELGQLKGSISAAPTPDSEQP